MGETDRTCIVADSCIAGKGAFAGRDITGDELIGEYTGEVIGAAEASGRYARQETTYLFYVEEDRLIDARGSDCPLRYVNHSCDPNCYAGIKEKRVFYYAARDIKEGEELTIDYDLIVDEDDTFEYRCTCGAENCRGTMKAAEEESRSASHT